jgi:hypothetical protein
MLACARSSATAGSPPTAASHLVCGHLLGHLIGHLLLLPLLFFHTLLDRG